MKPVGKNMDTSTHIAIGFGLGGLACLSPEVSANPELTQAIILGTVIGSNAPDFDFIIKLIKGNSMYIEHHRGLSHSIPAIFSWVFLLSGLIYLFYKDISYTHLLIWISVAVILHVLLDLMNAYGTQAARPFTKHRFSLNVLPLFDPIIMFAHLIGFVLWVSGYHPGIVFFYIYLLLVVYIAIRSTIAIQKLKFIVKQTQKQGISTIIPTIWPDKWDVVLETKNTFRTGCLTGKQLNWIHYFEKQDLNCSDIQLSLQNKDVQHFLSNSKHVYVLNLPNEKGIEIRWIDLRFRSKLNYPYMAIVQISHSKEILSSYAGWVRRPANFDLTKKVKNPVMHM